MSPWAEWSSRLGGRLFSSRLNDGSAGRAIFGGRSAAGVMLAQCLAGAVRRRAREDTVIVGLGAGGAVVAFEIARSFNARLEALASGPESQQLSFLRLQEREVVLVGDGTEKTTSVVFAAKALRKAGARRVVLAVPACDEKLARAVLGEVDEVVRVVPALELESGRPLYAPEELPEGVELRGLIAQARELSVPLRSKSRSRGLVSVESVRLSISPGRTLEADLIVPEGAEGIVVFAHGAGSSRSSARNRIVAGTLQDVRLGTLLMDLHLAEELGNRELLFDVDRLSDRVSLAVDWLWAHHRKPVGLFGASSGAAAALCAAARTDSKVESIVCRSGRPDFAARCLSKIAAPTLFAIGGEDAEVLQLTRQAISAMPGETDLEVIPGATHLFVEQGALEAVAHLAVDWYLSCFRHSSQHGVRAVLPGTAG